MALYKQSAAYVRAFLMVDASDHLTGKTGLTVTVTLSKNGGAFGAAGGTVAEISSGWYKITLSTTDTNTLGDLAFHCTGTGADPTDFADQVVAVDPMQSTNFGMSLLDAAISTRLPTASYSAPPSAASISSTVWAEATRSLTDKAGFALSAAGVQAIWDALTSALTTVGSVGKRIADNLDAQVSTRLATGGYTAPDNAGISTLTSRLTAGRATNLDNLDAAVSTRLATAGYTAPLTASQVENAVLDATAASHNTAGTVGNKINAAGSAGDPWTTALPGAYGAGTAGAIVGGRLDATVSSRATPSTVLDEPLAGHLGAGSVGEAIDAAAAGGGGGGGGLTATDVENAVLDATMADHLTPGSVGAKINAAGAGAGSGALSHTHTVYEPDGTTPASDVDVQVATDAAGTNVVASGKTDAFGRATFSLDAGTYYLFRQRSGTNFANPVQIVVS